MLHCTNRVKTLNIVSKSVNIVSDVPIIVSDVLNIVSKAPNIVSKTINIVSRSPSAPATMNSSNRIVLNIFSDGLTDLGDRQRSYIVRPFAKLLVI